LGNIVKPGEEALGVHPKAVEAPSKDSSVGKGVKPEEEKAEEGSIEAGASPETPAPGNKGKKGKGSKGRKQEATPKQEARRQEMDGARFREWGQHLFKCLQVEQEQKNKVEVLVTPGHFQNTFVVATKEKPPTKEALLL